MLGAGGAVAEASAAALDGGAATVSEAKRHRRRQRRAWAPDPLIAHRRVRGPKASRIKGMIGGGLESTGPGTGKALRAKQPTSHGEPAGILEPP